MNYKNLPLSVHISTNTEIGTFKNLATSSCDCLGIQEICSELALLDVCSTYCNARVFLFVFSLLECPVLTPLTSRTTE